AAHAGACGDVGHAHCVETGLGHQLRESGEQLGTDMFTVLGEGRADDLGHAPSIPFRDELVESVVKTADCLLASRARFHDVKAQYRAAWRLLSYSGNGRTGVRTRMGVASHSATNPVRTRNEARACSGSPGRMRSSAQQE